MLKLGLILFFGFFQNSDALDYKSISINGINHNSSKEELIDEFGDPDRSFDPGYECGSYSQEQDYIKSLTIYKYPGFDILLVNNKVTFERIFFSELPGSLQIVTDQITITKNSSLEDFKLVFPASYQNYIKSKSVFRLLACDKCDDELHFRFNYDGGIVSMEFWSPC